MNEVIGTSVAWLMLGIVCVQFAIVLLRYVFGVGFVWAQDLILYMHAFLFLLAAGYTLACNAHVRVDIFYREARARTKALVDLMGGLCFLLPMCGVILFQSWPFVRLSWQVLEGSPEPSGLPAVFLLKSAIPVFAGLLALQGIALVLKAVLALKGEARALAFFAGEEVSAPQPKSGES